MSLYLHLFDFLHLDTGDGENDIAESASAESTVKTNLKLAATYLCKYLRVFMGLSL